VSKSASRRTWVSDLPRVDAHVTKPHEYKELPELTDEALDRAVVKKAGRPKVAHPRQLISLRLRPDVIARWRSTGPGWQTRMAERLSKTPMPQAKPRAGGLETDPGALKQALVDAITGRRTLSFVYNGKTRLVEPQCYGVGKRGFELLRGHQLEGGTEREPLFSVSKISELVMLDRKFARPGPNYKRDDSAMAIIFAQL
jgi:uncharacterized protein (DUF4415 family)